MLQILQRWFNYHLRQAGHDQTIANFGNDLKDGVNFIVLMRQIAPKLVDHSLIDAALASTDPGRPTQARRAMLSALSLLSHTHVRARARSGPALAAGDKIEDRARAVVRLAENLNCRQFVSIRSITSGHARLNLGFIAVLFNTVRPGSSTARSSPPPMASPRPPITFFVFVFCWRVAALAHRHRPSERGRGGQADRPDRHAGAARRRARGAGAYGSSTEAGPDGWRHGVERSRARFKGSIGTGWATGKPHADH